MNEYGDLKKKKNLFTFYITHRNADEPRAVFPETFLTLHRS